jgi:hypothetical protein
MALDLGLLDAAGAPAVRRPALMVAVNGDAEALAGAVLAVDVDLASAPAVDRCTVTVAASAPPVPVGAEVAVSADAGDGEAVDLVTGTVAAVGAGARGSALLAVADASVMLAALRVERSYEQQTAGEIIGDLCAAAGVAVAELADGVRYPFVALHAGRPAWRHAGRLAAHGGLLVGVHADGAVWLAPPTPEDVAGAFAYGVDVLDLTVLARQPATVAGLVGEGAAGSQGADAWAWLARDPTPVRADLGAPPLPDGALRTPEAVTAAADAASAQAAGDVALTVPLAPPLRPGRGITVADVPTAIVPAGAAGLASTAAAAVGGPSPGPATATLAATMVRVRHRWRAGEPPTTRVDAAMPATPGAGGGLPPGAPL